MGCFCPSYFHLCTWAPTAWPIQPKREPLMVFFPTSSIFKPEENNAAPGPTGRRRRWFNPMRRNPLDRSSSPRILRHWIDTDPQPMASQERFTVVSYNILGVRNASKHWDLYLNVPSPYLRWDHRKRIICEELMGWNPDIICLQEVDRYFDLLNVMERTRYSGSYKRCTGNKVDGCAIFWKSDVFRLLEEESIEFKWLGLRDNVAQLSILETCNAESRKLIVCNIHVLYNPSRGDIKLGQIRHLLTRAQILSKKWGDVPVILGGDFNSTPQSAIYQFLSSSKLNVTLHDRSELSGQRNHHPSRILGVKGKTMSPLYLFDRLLKYSWNDEDMKIATGDSRFQMAVHPLNLSSAYAAVKGSTKTRDITGEPLATSYHSKFLGTVDYLWYSDGVVPMRVLDTLPFEVLLSTYGLPCKEVGSDHLALVAEFAFVKKQKKT